MITRLACWWLDRHGDSLLPYLEDRGWTILPRTFVGVIVSGHCFATGSKFDMQVHNPSGVVMAMNFSVVNFAFQEETNSYGPGDPAKIDGT